MANRFSTRMPRPFNRERKVFSTNGNGTTRQPMQRIKLPLKKSSNNCQQEYGEIRTLKYSAGVNVKWCNHCGK